MLAGKYDGGCFGTVVSFRGGELSREGSDYINEHYKDLIHYTKSLGISENNAYDLVNDVYLRLYDEESSGGGFNPHYFGEQEEITISQWIYSRIKKYSKNIEYRKDVVESAGSAMVYMKEVDIDGEVSYHRERVTYKTMSASFDSVDEDDSLQAAYRIASVSDDLSEIEEMMSLQEQIEFCVDICNLHEIKIVNVFKNIDRLGELLKSAKNNRQVQKVFSGLTKLAKEHDEFAEALTGVMRVAQNNRTLFDEALASYC